MWNWDKKGLFRGIFVWSVEILAVFILIFNHTYGDFMRNPHGSWRWNARVTSITRCPLCKPRTSWCPGWLKPVHRRRLYGMNELYGRTARIENARMSGKSSEIYPMRWSVYDWSSAWRRFFDARIWSMEKAISVEDAIVAAMRYRESAWCLARTSAWSPIKIR